MGVRRIARSRHGGEPDLARILNDGHTFTFNTQGQRLPCPSLDELREAWELHRVAIMAKYQGGMTRPWAWWQFDCSPKPAWEWQLTHIGVADGIRIRNRNRPSDDQQAEHLVKIGLLGRRKRNRK